MIPLSTHSCQIPKEGPEEEESIVASIEIEVQVSLCFFYIHTIALIFFYF